MKPEDKQLLLKDLCARLPYGVKAEYYGSEEERTTIDTIEGIDVTCKEPEIAIGQYGLHLDQVKPYLRSLSSMTDEEKKEYHELCDSYYGIYFDSVDSVDWLNAHHFDYRGLIKKDLASEAPEGMY